MDICDELPIFAYDSEVLPVKRSTCEVCARPSTVCVCHALSSKVKTQIKVIVLQHPAEQNRQLRTVPLLKAGLDEEKCIIHVGKRFRNIPEISSPKSVLLFPSVDSHDCQEIEPGTVQNLICIDGTWPQARCIYWRNPELHSLKKVMLSERRRSVYLIHTQPTDYHLSTLESVARALECLENTDDIEETLIKPLKEMVRLQFKFGSLAHSTKQEARQIRKQEIKEGKSNLTVAPKIENFNYDMF